MGEKHVHIVYPSIEQEHAAVRMADRFKAAGWVASYRYGGHEAVGFATDEDSGVWTWAEAQAQLASLHTITPAGAAEGLDRAWAAVGAFHRTFSQPAPERPTMQTPRQVEARAQWVEEEVRELRAAETLIDQADAYLDIFYFALGGLVELGVRPGAMFEIVHAANMAKADWPDGKGPRRRESDGKVLKPPQWRAPEPQLLAEVERQIALAA